MPRLGENRVPGAGYPARPGPEPDRSKSATRGYLCPGYPGTRVPGSTIHGAPENLLRTAHRSQLTAHSTQHTAHRDTQHTTHTRYSYQPLAALLYHEPGHQTRVVTRLGENRVPGGGYPARPGPEPDRSKSATRRVSVPRVPGYPGTRVSGYPHQYTLYSPLLSVGDGICRMKFEQSYSE